MRTHPILAKDGAPFAFEIENAYIAPSRIASLLEEVAGVTAVHLRRRFSKSPDVHVEFNYHGQSFMVWEPYDDSSRYWIGPAIESESGVNIGPLQQAFDRYRPPFYRMLIGDLLSLRFITRFFEKRTSP